MPRRWIVLALGASLMVAWAANAQEKSAVRPGFSAVPGGSRLLILRPRIRVGAQSTAGMFEPNADWTQQARDNLSAALAAT